MRKLLAGYLFRFLKSYEIWVLIVLYAVASAYLIFEFAREENFITITRGDFTIHMADNNEITITKDNVRDYKYESLDVSEANLYGFYSETMPRNEYVAILDSFANSEKKILLGLIEYLHVVPAVIVLILIPDFFGTMFKNRTIKNLIACGHSKAKIYLSSLVFSFLLNLAMIFATVTIFVLLCLFYMWKPPVYLPVVLVMFIAEIFITFALSSICLAVVFISGRRTVAFIASFLMIWVVIGVYLGKYGGSGSDTISRLYYRINDYESSDRAVWEEFSYILKNEGPNVLEDRFDVFTFREKTYYEGRELKLTNEGYMPPVQKFAWMAIIYMDPLMVERFESFGFEPYMNYREGLMAIELANNVFWILISSWIGLVVFKKREVKG